jgi:RNA polymerase sigma-70 factor (TIGR02960 family)
MSCARNLELRGGDEDAFRSLIEPHRRALHAHCCRMLGSPHDADDALQNTLLRAWRALPRFCARSSLRAWLYRIATNVCLDAIAHRRKRALPIDHVSLTSRGDAPEMPPSVAAPIERYPEMTVGRADGDAAPAARYERRESLELAFIAALQHLTPCQRAVLILRDVLGFSAKEAAESLETTVASVNGALLRARRTVKERLPEPSQHATPRTLADPRMRELVERFAGAFERGEIDTILALLTETRRRHPVGAIEVDSQRRPSCGYSPTTDSSPASRRRRSSPICRRRSRKSGGSRTGSSARTTPAPTSPAEQKVSERVERRAPAGSRPSNAQQEDCT